MGLRPKRIEKAIKTFYKIENLPEDFDALLAFSRKAGMFVVNGSDVLYCESPETIVDLTKEGQLEMAFVLDIPGTLGGVALAAQEYRRRRDANPAAQKAAVLQTVTKKHGL
jgi:hypothetical protein